MSSILIQNIQKGRVTSLALDESLSNPEELATTHFSCLLAALEQQQHLQNTNKKTNKRDHDSKYNDTTSIVRGIESVELSDHFLKSITSTSSLVVLLMYISKLPNLRKLRIYSVYIAWPVAIWSRFLQTAVRLESWHVTRGIRLTNAEDIEVLADCLKNHPSLLEVSLLDLGDVDGLNDIQNISANSTEIPLQIDDDTTENNSSSTPKMTLDSLVLALSTIPNLTTVDITVAPEFAPKLDRLSDASLQGLFSSSPHLLGVSLWEFGLDNGHMVVLKEAVQSHRRLQFLSLQRNPGITCAGWKTVSDMMEQNTTLVSLYYDDSATVDSEQRRLLTAHHDRIRLFLWLNQLGRGDLLTSAKHDSDNDNAWLAFLYRVSGDPDAVLYLLQANPQLCCGQGQGQNKMRQVVTSTISNMPSKGCQYPGEQLSRISLIQSRRLNNCKSTGYPYFRMPLLRSRIGPGNCAAASGLTADTELTSCKSTGYPYFRIPLLRSKIGLSNCAAASGLTADTKLMSNRQEQRSKESRRLFFISTLTQALELSDDMMDDDELCEERDVIL
jgi:hypothetical protein